MSAPPSPVKMIDDLKPFLGAKKATVPAALIEGEPKPRPDKPLDCRINNGLCSKSVAGKDAGGASSCVQVGMEGDDTRGIDHHIVREKSEVAAARRSDWFQIAAVPFEDFLGGAVFCRNECDRASIVDRRKLRESGKALSAIGYIHKLDMSVLRGLGGGLAGKKREQKYCRQTSEFARGWTGALD